MPHGPWILAHQGGWDEILFVLAPLVIFAALLVVARRRVDRMESDDRTRADRSGAMSDGTSPTAASGSDPAS